MPNKVIGIVVGFEIFSALMPLVFVTLTLPNEIGLVGSVRDSGGASQGLLAGVLRKSSNLVMVAPLNG